MVFRVPIPKHSPFTLHNIPFGVISTESNPQKRCAIAIGDYALDLPLYLERILLLPSDHRRRRRHRLDEMFGRVFSEPSLNSFAAFPWSQRRDIRNHLIEAISEGSVPESCFVPMDQVRMHLPLRIGGYADFFCSLEHCQNCSIMTGGTKDNFHHSPMVYNGRASSVVASPTPVRRPNGVTWDTGKGSGEKPVYGASKKMDFELEMGYFVSKPVEFGDTMSIEDAREHIFGFVLLNDWSSRDIQAFEMPPLGPFHSKGFGTSISPWVVTLDALQPFACSPKHDHSATEFEHLRWKDRAVGTFDIRLRASLIRNGERHRITSSNMRWLYWTPYQQLAHHASAGCGLETGDLLGSGTISGDNEGELGCLFEATMDGANEMELKGGGKLGYLEDGDEIVLEGWCGEGEERVGFGECRGVLLPATC
ncbi:fumarylacetoacetate hydrolase [Pleomassaria siparia CBS 279.74]|uniref:Fumarylacetoacetase n=1 Tax=Pleomassaria siparia CBS 279.74 TaxID=1314801 RepID=A0A6G1KIP4_9PLEO|nr:fumarylacetoacetate hydrolase [Pleomassaria siparia CBS 279.74]